MIRSKYAAQHLVTIMVAETKALTLATLKNDEDRKLMKTDRQKLAQLCDNK
jgi:hypothetical protein